MKENTFMSQTWTTNKSKHVMSQNLDTLNEGKHVMSQTMENEGRKTRYVIKLGHFV